MNAASRLVPISLFLSAILAAPALAAPSPAPTLKAAAEAYFQMQVPEAERLAQAVADDPKATADDRAAAARIRAHLHWLVDRDLKATTASLDQAIAAGADLCRSEQYYVRVLREAERPEAGVERARAHAGDCPGAAQSDQLLLERGKAALAWAIATKGAARAHALEDLKASIAGLSSIGALTPDAARLRLGLAVQTSDARGGLDAWRDYFWLTDRNAPESFKIADKAVADLFADALGAHPSLAGEIGFERLLIRGGFYADAKAFDERRDLSQRAAHEAAYGPVAAYLAFRKTFDAQTLAFDRAYAAGNGDGKAYKAAMEKLFLDTAAKVGPGDAKAVLRDAFGLHWMVGDTGGVASVHMGHVVEDNDFKVHQYGRQGRLRFISIDNMLANGYQSWLWDGMAATGGWSAGDGIIVQIRSGYTPAALQALASYDPEISKRNAAELKRFEAQDLETLKTRPIAFLPGLQARLDHEARDQVAAASRAEASRTGQPYERVFLRRFWDATIGHSILVHEGRHALDQAEFKGDQALKGPELEFRAKLSEMELAEFPRMALENILSADIGDETAHGLANARIMKGLADWIVAHPGEVSGYDATIPAPEQIDKLNDDQIRAVAKAMDPYFAEHPDQR